MKQCNILYRVRYALVLFSVYAIPAQIIFHTLCPFAILTGFPCPGCGLTRAGFCLLRGQFSAAWELHPLIYPWALLLLCFLIFRCLLHRDSFPVLPLAAAVSLATLLYYFYRCAAGVLVPVPCEGILWLAL